jgi:hypothetical protein
LNICLEGPDNVKKCIDYLQKSAREAGLPGVSIASCENVNNVRSLDALYLRFLEGFTHITAYNYVSGWHYQGPEKYIHPYSELAEDHKRIWDYLSNQKYLPYIPCVTCGWDARSWETEEKPEEHSWYYPDRTPEQVVSLVEEAGKWMDAHPDLTTKERITLLYAWNEFGEGGYIAPTKGDNGRYLGLLGDYLKK